jgi:predicted transcriptional regulator
MATGLSKQSQQQNKLSATQTDLLQWQSELRAACVNSISETDMREIVTSQLAKAKKGDAQAMKFVMELIGTKQPVTINNTLVVDTETAGRMANNSRVR